MKRKYLPFLLLPLFLLGFLLSNPLGVRGEVLPEGEWRDSGECIPTVCESTLGMREQTWYEKICEYSCPEKYFSWYVRDYKDCPEGYELHNQQEDKCTPVQPGGGNIDRPFDLVNKEAYVVYEKSQDPHKCHMPSSDTLMDAVDGYGMTLEAKNDFLQMYDEWYLEDENCDFYPTEVTQGVECNDATPFACQPEDPEDPGDPEDPENPETPEEPETPDNGDEGDTLGAATGPEDEIEEVGVVLAETGATSNILVYVIQAILTLSTIFSGIFFSKKYIM